jgi:hypothetical protein
VHDSISVVAHRRYVATEKQCLDVVTREGKFDRRQGPCQVTFDPLVHDSIKVNQLTQHIASQNEYLIVQYKDGRKDQYACARIASQTAPSAAHPRAFDSRAAACAGHTR